MIQVPPAYSEGFCFFLFFSIGAAVIRNAAVVDTLQNYVFFVIHRLLFIGRSVQSF